MSILASVNEYIRSQIRNERPDDLDGWTREQLIKEIKARRLPRKFLDDVRMRATEELLKDVRKGEEIVLKYGELNDPADLHEDIRETLWPFFEEIRLYVQGCPDCPKRIQVNPNTFYSCCLPEGHEGECQSV